MKRTGVCHTALAFKELPPVWRVSTGLPGTKPEGAESDHELQERTREGGGDAAALVDPRTAFAQRMLSDSAHSAAS